MVTDVSRLALRERESLVSGDVTMVWEGYTPDDERGVSPNSILSTLRIDSNQLNIGRAILI